jgi:uncharacterized membrane protein
MVKRRFAFLDWLRGLGVSFIVVFHFMWDMYYFEVLSPDPGDNHGTYGIPSEKCLYFLLYFLTNFILLRKVRNHLGTMAEMVYFIVITVVCLRLWWHTCQESGVALLMVILGLSSAIRHAHTVDWTFIKNRFLKLFALSCAISILTYIFYREAWIYFGALHCICLNSLLHIPFLQRPRLSLLAGIAILVYTPIFGTFPLEVPIRTTLDHIPWFHNLGFVLLGVASAELREMIETKMNLRKSEVFVTIGRKSLLIYLIHQPAQLAIYFCFKGLSRLLPSAENLRR